MSAPIEIGQSGPAVCACRLTGKISKESGMRIALIHALRESIEPTLLAFRCSWPEADLINLLDDSLSADLAGRRDSNDELNKRFIQLGRYAVDRRVDAILFTCSAFGSHIDKVAKELAPLPVVKPNEAMVAEASGLRGRVGLFATFAPTLQSMLGEFPKHVTVVPVFVEGALDALDAGDIERHDRLIADAAETIDVDIIALAQFSMARSATRIARTTDRKVLTTPGAAVQGLKRILHQ